MPVGLDSSGLVEDHLTDAEGGETEADGCERYGGPGHHFLTIRWLWEKEKHIFLKN